MTSCRRQKVFSPQYFHAHGETLKIGKMANFKRQKVNEDDIFQL